MLKYNLSTLIKGLLIVLLFNTSAYSLLIEKKLQELNNTKYWKTLLHIKNNESQIDSKNFFISKNGKYNSYKELQATINTLEYPKFKDDNSTYCRFPARRNWLITQLPNLNIKKQNCYLLNKELSELGDINTVTLVFPTTHLNSPASMFGHTLLRLDNNVSSITSHAINYAAFTDESNGFVYAWKGLTGGYIGKYSIVPYYKKIKEYGDVKNRDIWEYELNLDKKEIKKLILHLYEIKKTWSYYYYFNRNCSYEILWLLESAREKLELTKKFNYKTLPIETIKEISNENLINKSVFRASKMQIIISTFDKIKNKDLALEFQEKIDFDVLNSISKNQKIYIIDFSILMLQYNKIKNNITKDYLKNYLKLLKLRSKLGNGKEINIKKPINPIKGHKVNKASIYVNSNDSINIHVKPSLHAFNDINYAYLQGAYIDFFKLNIRIDKEKASLEDFSVFDIESLSKRTRLFKPYSWKIDIGVQKIFNDELYFKSKIGVGLTYGSKNYLYYILATANYYAKKHKNYISYGPQIGFEYNFENLKLGIKASHEIFKHERYNNTDSFIVYSLSDNFTLELGYKNKYKNNFKYLGLNYFF